MERTRTRRWGPGKAAAVRRLYEAQHPITQVELAAHAKVSQPAVSQYLANLSDSGDAAFSNPGWLPARDRLPDTYRSHYSSRFTEQSVWYRVDSVTAQVTDLVERYPGLIISGDVAADLIRPWRVPTVAIAYGDVDDAAMDGLGFVRADSASTASVLVRPIPDDRFDLDAELREGTRTAPLLHLVADLIDLGGDDRAVAAERFASIYRVGQS